MEWKGRCKPPNHMAKRTGRSRHLGCCYRVVNRKTVVTLISIIPAGVEINKSLELFRNELDETQ